MQTISQPIRGGCTYTNREHECFEKNCLECNPGSHGAREPSDKEALLERATTLAGSMLA